MTTSPSNGATASAGHRSALALAALELVAAGHPVLPLHTPTPQGCSCGRRCGSPGKHPRGVYGLSHASCNQAQVEAWWWAHPEANIGMRCDGIVALDIDGPEGQRSLEQLEVELGSLPPTWGQQSGRGEHLLFGIPDEAPVGNSTRALGDPPGLDLRAGSRGYLVVAPSLHASGSRYRRLAPERPFARLPDRWLERLLRPRPPASPELVPLRTNGETTGYGLAALRGELAKIRSTQEGNRNNQLNTSVFKLARLVRAGKLELALLEREAELAALECGLGREETQRTIGSALTAGWGASYGWPTLADARACNRGENGRVRGEKGRVA
jgi:hypothetical protein